MRAPRRAESLRRNISRSARNRHARYAPALQQPAFEFNTTLVLEKITASAFSPRAVPRAVAHAQAPSN